ncbi:MAG: PhoP regulatory network YrbL family protein [Chromatiales bacterium]|nr:PhoP regulatory network YrbL family protein [Chromatiales bacterium]
MIHLETVLTQGRTRTIYEHPTDQGWVIKVLKRHTYATGGKLSLVIRSTLHSFFPSLSDNLRDLRNYKKLSADLKLYIPEYRPTLIQTDKGPGLASQKVLDDNGQPSQTLLNYLQDNKRLSNELKHLSEQFFDTLLKKQLYFFDFNQNNFLIQRKTVRSI